MPGHAIENDEAHNDKTKDYDHDSNDENTPFIVTRVLKLSVGGSGVVGRSTSS